MNLKLPFETDKVIGIEAIIAAGGDISISSVILTRKKDKIAIENSATGKISEPKIPSAAKYIPAYLAISGKGVIHKKVAVTSKDEIFEPGLLLGKVLPNSDPSDFYIEYRKTTDDIAFISIARKNTIDKILDQLSALHVNVIYCALGPFVLQNTLPAIIRTKTEAIGTLNFSVHQLEINNYKIIGCEQTSEVITDTDQLTIESRFAVPFSCAVRHFDRAKVDSLSNIDRIKDAMQNWEYKMLFSRCANAILVGAFTIFLINFISFFYLSESISKRTAALTGKTEQINLLDSLGRELQSKKDLLTKSGFKQYSKTSFYADQLAQNIPDEINLKSLTIQPVKKNDQDEKTILFEQNIVLVSGDSKFSLALNDWIKSLKQYKWVKRVDILNYAQKDKNIPGEFILQILVK